MAIQPEHRSILVVDIEEFSQCTNRVQLDLHRRLRDLLQDALQAGEINKDACEWEDRGDGFLVTIGAEVPKSRLLDPVIPLLAKRVDADNRTAEPAWRLRLRAVVHAGEVLRDPKANVGQAVVAACRLLDAPELRARLKATRRPLVVAVSDWIHQEVVQHGYGRIDRAAYRPMPFTSKNTIGHAWVHVPDPEAPVAASITRSRPPRTSHRPTGPHGYPSESVDADAQEEAAIPVDLPGDIASFTGRSKELKRLQRLFADARRRRHAGLIVVSAIAGKGGVGKTALAVHAAYRLQSRFPDGQLYVNLRGAERQALQPADVLAQMLRALGVPSALIPEDVDERAGLYRRRLAKRRVLIVLDNAAAEAQIRPLLPGGGSSALLITSRKQLAGLDMAATIRLDVLQPAEALDLLGKLAGRARVEKEPEAARSIIRLCGYLPLAVRIAGAKLHAKPHLPLRRVADQLANQHRRLDTLQVGDLDVRASFLLSYQHLPADQRRLFRLLGLLEAADFPTWVAAALLDCPIGRAADLLERLDEAQLLEATGEDAVGQLRYRFHDLLRVFARERATRGDPRARREPALQRAIGGYLSLAATATGVLDQGRQHLTTRTEAGKWAARDPIAVAAANELAVEWFTTERANLLTSIEQAHKLGLWAMTWELADSLASFLDRRGYWNDRRHTCEFGLQAACRAGDRRWQAKMLYGLGTVRSDQSYWEEALGRSSPRPVIAPKKASSTSAWPTSFEPPASWMTPWRTLNSRCRSTARRGICSGKRSRWATWERSLGPVATSRPRLSTSGRALTPPNAWAVGCGRRGRWSRLAPPTAISATSMRRWDASTRPSRSFRTSVTAVPKRCCCWSGRKPDCNWTFTSPWRDESFSLMPWPALPAASRSSVTSVIASGPPERCATTARS